ncbi:hypothetical protein BU14_0098s0044 [Porphyra umbilicalis]|uniref:Uncharacterized protein n=1 Tax=Porphyra umbilicalis TaxID=2786 RepID=A0A1X6PD65_PORUM|nr:hypothetical protein BU14_0098s0044 [Porphyra umbilicalis]|eukprot:OSX78818.1 hypothetical protein BU14_0098s0044 [Porphyra umbilicalis]
MAASCGVRPSGSGHSASRDRCWYGPQITPADGGLSPRACTRLSGTRVTTSKMTTRSSRKTEALARAMFVRPPARTKTGADRPRPPAAPCPIVQAPVPSCARRRRRTSLLQVPLPHTARRCRSARRPSAALRPHMLRRRRLVTPRRRTAGRRRSACRPSAALRPRMVGRRRSAPAVHSTAGRRRSVRRLSAAPRSSLVGRRR